MRGQVLLCAFLEAHLLGVPPVWDYWPISTRDAVGLTTSANLFTCATRQRRNLISLASPVL